MCLHLTSLPGRYGIGEIGSQARSFIDTLRRMELGVWQFLPLGPTAYGDSPYQPLSAFAGNEMLIDIDELVKLSLLSEHEVRKLTELPHDYVDYGALIPLKSELITLACSRFASRADSVLKSGFDRFLETHNDAWLHDYALFRLLKSQHGERPWPEWQPEYVHRESNALRRLENEQAKRISELKIGQYLFRQQWQALGDYAHERGIRLFGDMPIYIALDSSDSWAKPELLRIDHDGRPDYVAGVPPDYFSEDGQLWGNPLYDWPLHAATGYQWWIDRLRASAELADIVRIDHFRGFESYWSVPGGAETARAGVWEPGPGDGIFDAMQAALGSLPIVAEDLGIITPEVEALRDRHQIPGMVVLQFALPNDEFQLTDVQRNRVCYTGTHDNDTTLGWFLGGVDDPRSADEIANTRRVVTERIGANQDTVSMDLVRAAFGTDAYLAIAPLQDYLGLGSEARLNTPGTLGNNWRWRVNGAQLSDELCHTIASAAYEAGRELPNG